MNEKVLIVEDNGVIAMELKQDLQRIGYTVAAITTTGEEALLLAVTTPIDIVIMDIRLNGKLDGIETAEIMIKDFYLPVVYLTAHSDRATFERVKKTNPHGYLIKPFDLSVLSSTLEIAMHKSIAEKKLRESEILFRTLVESSHDGIFILKDLVVVYANEAFSQLVNIPLQQVIGNTIERFLDGDNTVNLQNAVSSIIRGEQNSKNIEIIAHAGQESQVYLAVCLSVINFRGELSVMGTAMDITMLKQRELELIESKNEIERSDYLKTEFIGLISHEIRTPINIIYGYTAMLQEDTSCVKNDVHTHALDKLSMASAKLIDSADKIIEYSQLATNTFQMCKRSVVLDEEILEGLVFNYTMKAQSKSLKLFYNNYAAGERVFGDKEMIEKLVDNILANAVKFTTMGIVEVNLQKKQDRELWLEIMDTGPGIENHYIKNLFNPGHYQQSYSQRTFDGTGFGLTMVKRYAELNGIRVALESEKGKGTVVKVIFNL